MTEIVLQTEGLTKQYGSLTAVNDLTLSVHQGEIFGFLGPNGAGKTTAINMMCGLLKPDAGQVFIQGRPVAGGDAGARARVGMCPQDIILWESLTCLEQLQFVGQMYGLSRHDARRSGEQLLAELDLQDKRMRRADTLSGGMQRRLNLALALVHDPEIIVLDEPEAGLDPQSRVKVRQYIRSLARQKTIILTTHNMDEADRMVDRLAIIDHGRLLVLDTPAALKRSSGEGDVLEIKLVGQTGDGEKVRMALTRLGDQVEGNFNNGTLVVRALSVVELLPGIMETLAAVGLQSGDIRLRENTLEDVFIQLTGRRLRE